MIAGFILIVVGLVMTYQVMRNARRPRIEVRIDEIVFDHIRNDRKRIGPKQAHALVKFNYDGTNYESKVFLNVRGKSEGDWIEVCINPTNPVITDIFTPEKERRVIFVLFMIGAFLIAGSWWILDYFDSW